MMFMIVGLSLAVLGLWILFTWKNKRRRSARVRKNRPIRGLSIRL